MRIEVEEAVGLKTIGEGRGHAFRDCTSAPAPTVVADRPVRVRTSPAVERGARLADNKPPYRVPSMADVRDVEPCGLSLVSTFSGCGGSCLGFRMEGYRVLWASEFVPAARAAYLANCDSETVVDDRDVRLVDPAEVMRDLGLERGEIDVLEGSPPCASFSTAGKRAAHWGQVRAYSDVKQRTDDLFFEFARLVEGFAPRAFAAENVSGLVKGVAKGYFLEIMAALKRAGYRVKARLLDAQWLGVPQARQRLIFVGLREDLGMEPRHPRPLPYRYSVADACPWIAAVATSKGISAGPAPTVMQHGRDKTFSKLMAIEPGADFSRFAVGREARRLREVEHSERYLNLSRAHRDRPCPTVTAPSGLTSAATVIHPTELRRFSIAELKRICGFPDDFDLPGTYAQQWERLGRAVPPPMMRAVARELRLQLTGEAVK